MNWNWSWNEWWWIEMNRNDDIDKVIICLLWWVEMKKQVEKQYIWCYYCDREFEDENTLISHKLLVISNVKHVERSWVHFVDYWVMLKQLITLNWKRLLKWKELMIRVPHALVGRDNTATDIHGMTRYSWDCSFWYL